MNTPPVSLPAEHIPPGTAAWRSADARVWLSAVPARWAHPLWATVGLAGGAVWFMESGPEPSCTPASPCGVQDWLGFGLLTVLLLTFYWLWRQPRLALAGLGCVAAALVVDEVTTGGGSLAEPSWAGFVLALAFAAAGALHRLGAAARQHALALAAAGPTTARLPRAAHAFRRGRLSFAVAAVLLAVAGYGFWQAGEEADAYEQRAARLAPATAEVTKVHEADDGAFVLTLDVGDRIGTRTVETLYPEDFPVGSRVDVLVDGDWVRLLAEPYDSVGWELLMMAATVLGLAFLANGVDGRSRAERLRRGPLPVLRVLVREGHADARTWVYAADDPAGERPLLHFHSLFAAPGDEDAAEDEPDEDAAAEGLQRMSAILKGEDPPPPLREAVLYGVPCAGAELAFVAREDEDDSEASVECSVTAVKPAVPRLLTGRAPGAEPDRESSPQNGEAPGQGSAAPVAARMAPSVAPRVYTAHGMSRAVGLVLLLVQGAGIWAAVSDGPSWRWLFLLLTVPWLVNAVSTALNWRITADRRGLWVTGAWRVRRIPWDAVTGVRHTEDRIVIRGEEGERTALSPTGWAWLERRLGREPHAVRTADEVRALVHDPDLRPWEEASAGQQGMPLGPALVAVSVLWGAAVLLLG
ncbi:hypothetical protein [Streptomyces sp. CC77]|uniref:hypothetical protein n=1 Tax=Streptomyces sp. CC77 TaxID=1906739 RepID=UPI000AE2F8BB|nr:hypothetical protein [Streptomyces sp. CC77]